MNKLIQEVLTNDYKKVKNLLQTSKIDPSSHNNYAVRLAISKGYYDIARLLISDKRVDVSLDISPIKN